jgi:transcriptional regulator with XRE-family HTH domain
MHQTAILDARQIKAARALADWSQGDLATATTLSVGTIRKLELGHVSPRGKTNQLIRKAFENAGLEFLEPDGVRHRPEEISIYQGRDGYVEFFDDVYATARNGNEELVTVCASEVPFNKIRGEDDTSHTDRMMAIKDTVTVKCILTESTEELMASGYCEYRWISKHYVNSVPFYVYGDKYAAIIFEADPSPKIIVIRSPVMSRAYRQQFESMWEKATPVSAPQKTTVAKFPNKRTA